MDRKALFEQALKETGSLVKAVELVKTIEGFLFFKPEDLQANPEPKKTIPLIFTGPSQTQPAPKLSLPGYKNAKKAWKPGEIAMAEAMMNQGKDVREVAVATERTAKAIQNALSVGVLKPKIDPRNPRRRAAAYKSVIARGEHIKDYKTAEALIDSQGKKG